MRESESGRRLWNQLTNINANFVGSVGEWKALIGGCTLLEQAYVTLTLCPDSSVASVVGVSSVPRLVELDLRIEWGVDEYDIARVLDGIELPALKTLFFRADRLTVNGLHRLLTGTRVLERIRLSCDFGERDVIKFPITTARLVNLAPHLQLMTIDIANIVQFKNRFKRDVDDMRRSGWLDGPWKNGKLCIEFYWGWDCDDLEVFLEWPNQAYGFGEVDITLRSVAKRLISDLGAE
jgi:hypothetical protein